MAAKEIYDYVVTDTADVAVTLSVSPQKVMTETADRKQVIHEYDDGSIDVASFSSTTYFNITLMWSNISESDAGTILDLYHTSADGREKTFYFNHPDGHTYVVRFMGPLRREYTPGLMAGGRIKVDTVTLRVEAKVVDA